jgi:glycolate oxidase FAD binding subunit
VVFALDRLFPKHGRAPYSAAERLVVLVIVRATSADESSGDFNCFLSYPTIAKWAGVSIASVKRALQKHCDGPAPLLDTDRWRGRRGAISTRAIALRSSSIPRNSLRLAMPQEHSIEALNRWAGQPLPVSASVWHAGELMLRLSGSAAALGPAAVAIGGEAVESVRAATFWPSIREQAHPFFAGPEPLWRIAVPSITPPLELPGRQLMEWGGGLRWLKSACEPSAVRDAAKSAKGHATLFRAARKPVAAFSPLEPVVLRLHRELKAAFDPAGIFNPGRLYPEL